ncbi:uncharacterized protein FIBRA_06196 [Fibroporia radiculosa]|uniref:Nucleolar protein 9 n=1 Tax=Fibroporia radiculosa TaxID=599839 RepID=J4GAT2_9APHY|nr:uncharacterized protein FIBRA_06196 [Fibroporia radiculosa]CCM04038.1 predicted protein [Fibroporia radiculosa]
MPRENRKRGKKHRKKPEEEQNAEHHEHEQAGQDLEPHAGVSWMVSVDDRSDFNPEAPFGYVDAEVKAYFRTVDLQIRDWQEQGMAGTEGDGDTDPNEDRRLFFVAALTEMSGKEKQLATDPDCSSIVERMSYSMDDFIRRVFMDRLSGSFEQLSKHRFASHVCQTLFGVASETISRETRGIFPTAAETSDEGELRTLMQLVLDACEELLPTLSSLIVDPFASHVIRALLLLLVPDCFPSMDGPGHSGSSVRSKRSVAYKAKQGSMKSVFSEHEGQTSHEPVKDAPEEFRDVAKKFVVALRENLDENEVRALAADKVASPVLQMFLEVESGCGMSDIPGSLMDRTLVGLITLTHEDPSASPEASDYLTTLLRDPTSSHLLETLVRRSPDKVFNILWPTYFSGKLSRLAVHPVANFVVARAIERATVEQLGEICHELEGVAEKIIKASRTGVLRALVDRAAGLKTHEEEVVEVICAALELKEQEERRLVVPCILYLKGSRDYQAAAAKAGQATKPEAETQSRWQRGKIDANQDSLEPKTQGAVLLQSLLRLSAPHNQIVVDSIQALRIDQLIEMAHHVTSSRVLDVLLDSPTVPTKAKRSFVLTFMGHFPTLVDDRIGSRIGARLWAFADPYLKEKIARSIIPHEHHLAGSFFGKFFVRSLSLHLLQRNPEQWKDLQSATKQTSSQTSQQKTRVLPPTSIASVAPEVSAVSITEERSANADKREKRNRKARSKDEIDELFDTTLGNKTRKSLVTTATVKNKTDETDSVGYAGHGESKKRKHTLEDSADQDLKNIMGAIRAAPKDDGERKKKKRRG